MDQRVFYFIFLLGVIFCINCPANLLLNGGFEDDLDDDNVPDHWEYWNAKLDYEGDGFNDYRKAAAGMERFMVRLGKNTVAKAMPCGITII